MNTAHFFFRARRATQLAALTSSLLVVSLPSFSSASPLADTAVGTGTVLGNAVYPGPDPTRPQDPEWPIAKHTPTGQMFKIPFAMPEVRKVVNGWEYSGQLEFGYLGGDGDEESARFRMYQDIDNGAYLNNLRLSMRKPEGGYNVEVSAGGAGRDDQYYGLQFGRANAWKVKLFFSEIPHVFTNRYKSLWTGTGTDTLTLVPGLTPGGTASTAADNAAVAAIALDNTGDLSLTRERSGVRVDLDITANLKAYVSYTLEQRKGARPFAAVWGNNPGTAPIDLAEPIDYDTHEILAGFQYVSGLNALNVRFTASKFENKIDTLTFDQPYRIAPAAGITTVPAAGAFTQGRIDLMPSNDSYNARAEYTRSMPNFYRGYFTAVVSGGEWRQDDTLLPYVVTPSVALANVTLLPGGNWDSVTALSRRTTDAVIDTRLVDLTLSLNPTAALNVKAKARYYENDNQTDPFLSVNPNAVYNDADSGTAGNQTRGVTFGGVTGVWGRPLNDGSGQSVLFGTNANPAGNIPAHTLPYSTKQYRVGATADYRLSKFFSYNAAIDRETYRRTFRDRDRTWDDRVKVGLVGRELGRSTVRLSYEYGRRRGDEYIPNRYGEGFSAAMIPMPTATGAVVTSWVRANSGLRMYDLADRNQFIANVRVDTMVRSNLDAGISLQFRDSKYPDSDYGRQRDFQDSANIDLTYQPSPRQTVYAFYSYQIGKMRQASMSSANAAVTIGGVTALGTITPDNAVEIGSAPGGPVFPLINAWSSTSRDRNHVAGFGLKQEIKKASLHLDYAYSVGRTRITYDYTVGGAINANNALLAGARMPDLALDMSYIDASLRFPLTERLGLRLVHRYQKETIRDWHYRGVDNAPVALGANAGALPTAVILDGGPQDYTVKWFGVVLQLKL